jgi:hypothetical protein
MASSPTSGRDKKKICLREASAHSDGRSGTEATVDPVY